MATMYLSVIYDKMGNGAPLNVPDGTTVAAYTASSFVKPPRGTTQPPVAATASGTTASGLCQLTGITAATSYWVWIVIATGQGQWFLYNDTSGTALATPLVCRVPYLGRFYARA